MFLHNKCLTRPPYPYIRLALYKVKFSVFSDADALYAVQLQTVQIKKCILLTVSATTPLVQRVFPVIIVTPSEEKDRLATNALPYCGIQLCASQFLLYTKYI